MGHRWLNGNLKVLIACLVESNQFIYQFNGYTKAMTPVLSGAAGAGTDVWVIETMSERLSTYHTHPKVVNLPYRALVLQQSASKL